MHRAVRLPALAAMLNVCLGAGVAAGQTVIVRKAPPGTRVEVVVNATAVASGSVDEAGDAKVPFQLAAAAGKPEIDANVFLDTCDTTRRVIVIERDRLPPAPETNCTRRQIPGVFWVRQVNTLVVDVGGANPTLLLIRGSYGLGPDAVPTSWATAMTGLSVFGGGGFGKFRDARALACGNVTPCGGHDSGLAYTAGATWWFSRFLGVEGSYVKPGKATATGSGEGYSFDSSLDTQMATMVGKVGVPAGPVKLYGLAGASYHGATSRTVQTIDGATQTLEFETEGWGWLFGGGAEVWLAPRVALYTEASFTTLKGEALGGGEALIDDRLRLIAVGLKVRISR